MINSSDFMVAIRWIACPFVVLMLLVAGLLFWEAASVALDDAGYVWTTEGPFPWYYKSRGLYVYTTTIKALNLLAICGLLVWPTRLGLTVAAVLALVPLFISMRPILLWGYQLF